MSQQNINNMTRAQLAPYNTEGALKLRLDTSAILKDIELNLKGEILDFYQDETTGEIKTRTRKIGTRKANDRGIQAIMNFLEARCNTAVVQGNLNNDNFENFIFWSRLELNKHLFLNRENYEISPYDYEGVVNDTLGLLYLFVSRTIDNEERKSYAQTIKTTESATIQQNKGILPI